MDPHSFFADPDPGTKKIRIRIRIQLNKICKTINSWRAFYSCKNHEILLKRKNQWSLCKFTFKNWINLQLCSIFLHFSVFIWKTFPPGSGSRRENEFGSMRIQIHSPAYYTILINLQHFNSERHSNAVIFMYIIKTYIKIHNHWSKLNHPSPLLVTNPIINHHARSSNLISQAVHLEEQVQLLHSSHDFLVTTVDEPDQLLKC